MQYRYKSILAVLVITGVIVILANNGYIPYGEYTHRQIETFSQINSKYNAHYGYIQPRVVDGFSERPIEKARVVIPEIGKKFITNSEGYTPIIRVPINTDNHYQNILPKTWGNNHNSLQRRLCGLCPVSRPCLGKPVKDRPKNTVIP